MGKTIGMKAVVRASLLLLLSPSHFLQDATCNTLSKRESEPEEALLFVSHGEDEGTVITNEFSDGNGRYGYSVQEDDSSPPPSIDRTTPKTVRAVNGEDMALPCTVLNPTADTTILWTRKRDSQVLAVGTTRVTDDSRFTSIFSDEMSTFFLNIDPVLDSDEGEYECFITNSYPKEKALLDLQVIEPSDDLSWNTEMRCGHWWSNKGGFECDPEGAYPCCSGYGWCGFTDLHCKCDRCVDFRTHNSTEETSSGKLWRDDFKCGWPHEVLEGPHKGEIAICNPQSETNFCCSIHGWCGGDRYYCE